MSMDLESTFESLEDLTAAQLLAAERHPEIAHLAEFITASNGQGVMDLAADMSRRLKQAGPTPQPGPRTTANSGRETPPAEEQEEKQPTSAEILAGFREGRTHKRDPEAGSAYFTAKLREAAGQ
jgi:hypothetical protein